MNRTEYFTEKNIELSAEFSRYLFEHPELEQTMPSDAELVLLPEFDSELKAHNLAVGRKIKKSGGKVVYVSVAKMRQRSLSRIEQLAVVS